MTLFDKLAEERLRAAIEEGAFDALPNFGRPLDLEDPPHVPAELRSAYRILKNAGCLPEELELRREVVRLQDLLAAIADDDPARAAAEGELRRAALRYELLMERSAARLDRGYRAAVLGRLGRGSGT